MSGSSEVVRAADDLPMAIGQRDLDLRVLPRLLLDRGWRIFDIGVGAAETGTPINTLQADSVFRE